MQTSRLQVSRPAIEPAPDDRAWFLKDSRWEDPVWRFAPTNALEEELPVIGFVEFDDQGWYHDRGQQLALFSAVREWRTQNSGARFLMVAFAHGWLLIPTPS